MLKIRRLASCDNPRIKEIIKLRQAHYRKENNLFIIEGYREFKLALRSNLDIVALYYCPSFFKKDDEHQILKSLLASRVSLFEVDQKLYNKISYGDRKEGLIALARQPSLSLDNIKLKTNPLLVVADSIEKPGNIGAILRTSDGCGIDGLIVSGGNADVYNPNTVRSSMGTIFTVAIAKAENAQAFSYLKKHKIKIVSASTQAKLIYSAFDFRSACAIVLGSEDKGLSEIWKENADCEVRIPMVGAADSLNVSVAASVLLFEALRQRGFLNNASTGVSVA